MTSRHPLRANALLLALVGAALLLRAFVPVGWMPARAADGVAIELCAGLAAGGEPVGAGAARALFEAALAGAAQPDEGHKGQPDPGDQPCIFAGLTPFTPPPVAAAPAAPPLVAAPPLLPALAAAVGRGLPAPPPPATGPPLLA